MLLKIKKWLRLIVKLNDSRSSDEDSDDVSVNVTHFTFKTLFELYLDFTKV